MRLSSTPRLLSLVLAVGAVTFACSSDESSPGTVPGTGGTSTASATTDSTATTGSPTTTAASSMGGATSTSTTSPATTMGGASAAVTSDAVTVDSTSNTVSTADSTSSTGAGGSSTSGGAGGATSMGAGGTMSSGEFTFTSPAFDDLEGCTCQTKEMCDTFPEENTSFHDTTPHVSPEFNWSGAPGGTQSYAIVLQDIANGYVHWAIWNIPGTATMLAADLPDTPTLSDPEGAQQATFFSMMGYFGPGACNVYEFTLYALDTATFTPSSTSDPEMVKTSLDGAGALATATIRARADEAYCNGGGTCDI